MFVRTATYTLKSQYFVNFKYGTRAYINTQFRLKHKYFSHFTHSKIYEEGRRGNRAA